VWRTLAAFDELSRWGKGIDHSSYTTALKQGVGATRRVQSGRSTVLERIVEWSPPTGFAYAIEGLPKLVRGVINGWELQPEGDGTRVTLTSRIDPGERIAERVAAAVVARVLARISDRLLDGLAEHCGQRGGTP
jgi:hypothetical protein